MALTSCFSVFCFLKHPVCGGCSVLVLFWAFLHSCEHPACWVFFGKHLPCAHFFDKVFGENSLPFQQGVWFLMHCCSIFM